MLKRRTNQERQTFFEQYESSQLSQRLFCERNELSLSTFKVIEKTKVTNVGCFAHDQSKFMDAKKLQDKGKSCKADKALAQIQKLYGMESRLKGHLSKRQAECQTHAKPILDEALRMDDDSENR